MRWNREKKGLRASLVTNGLLGVLAVLGLIAVFRELPAMRRYLRMERM